LVRPQPKACGESCRVEQVDAEALDAPGRGDGDADRPAAGEREQGQREDAAELEGAVRLPEVLALVGAISGAA
jgi:hypothetical protein